MGVVRLAHFGLPTAKACTTTEAELLVDDDLWPESASTAELATSSSFYAGLIVEANEDGELCGYAGITKLGSAGAAGYKIHTIGVG